MSRSPSGTTPIVVGHRGAAALWPENSQAGFQKALALGVTMVEFDVHPSRDGELAVIHDPTLDRTTSGRGPVNERDWRDLARLALIGTAGEPIPRLGEILGLLAAAGATAIVEIKEGADGAPYPGIAPRVLAAIAAGGMTARCRISAFHWPTLVELRALSTAIGLVGVAQDSDLRAAGGLGPAIARLAAIGANDIGLDHRLIDAAMVAAARASGLGVGAWTVNDGAEILRLAGLGVDWIISDRPDMAMAALAGRPEKGETA